MPPAVNDCQTKAGGFCVIIELSSGATGTGVSPVTGPIILSVQLVTKRKKMKKRIYRLLCVTTPPLLTHSISMSMWLSIHKSNIR